MKKAINIAALASALVCTLPLCACAKTPKRPESQTPELHSSEKTQETPADDPHEIEIKIEGGYIKKRTKPSAPGVIRRATHSRNGVYTVEYVHYPFGEERDDTLDYRLELNADGSFTFNVVKKGVRSDHNGRWYERRGTLMLFYDEEREKPAHNEYVCDSMFGELLPFGKIMIYENGATVVLSQLKDDMVRQNTQKTDF